MPINATCPVAFLAQFRPTNLTQSAAATWNTADLLEKNLASSVALAIVLLIGSFFVLFMGKRLVRPCLFLAAFGAATSASFFATDSIVANTPALSPLASCVVLSAAPVCIGLLAGALALCFLDLGFLLLGAGAGAGFGYALYTGVLHAIPSPQVGTTGHDVTYVASLSTGALLGAILLCRCRDNVLIVATSALGASGVTAATAMLCAHANVHFLGPVLLSSPAAMNPNSMYAWSQAVFYVVAFILGVCVQSRTQTKEARKTSMVGASVPLISP